MLIAIVLFRESVSPPPFLHGDDVRDVLVPSVDVASPLSTPTRSRFSPGSDPVVLASPGSTFSTPLASQHVRFVVLSLSFVYCLLTFLPALPPWTSICSMPLELRTLFVFSREVLMMSLARLPMSESIGTWTASSCAFSLQTPSSFVAFGRRSQVESYPGRLPCSSLNASSSPNPTSTCLSTFVTQITKVSWP